jgi:geranyl diphosphate 2-C-methyltransferase
MFHSQDEMVRHASRHYDRQRDDRNERMARDPSHVNNHMGIGVYDGPASYAVLPQDRLTGILDDLENNQTAALFDRLGVGSADARVLDAGCGRGGPAFTLHERTGCTIDGVTVSAYQLAYARAIARTRGLQRRVRFHLMNYLHLQFPDASFDYAFSNETTMHAFVLADLFAELRRVLRPGGRYTLATWAADEAYAHNEFLDPINRHYQCLVHTRHDYVSSLERQGFEIVGYDDLTALAIPYWELRRHWALRSGIEDTFLQGHRSGKLLYLMISATTRSGAAP